MNVVNCHIFCVLYFVGNSHKNGTSNNNANHSILDADEDMGKNRRNSFEFNLTSILSEIDHFFRRIHIQFYSRC